jgi:hypothetical protein
MTLLDGVSCASTHLRMTSVQPATIEHAGHVVTENVAAAAPGYSENLLAMRHQGLVSEFPAGMSATGLFPDEELQ